MIAELRRFGGAAGAALGDISVTEAWEGIGRVVAAFVEQRIKESKPADAVSDVSDDCVRADDQNGPHLVAIARFLVFYAPSTAWGSPAIVEAWLADPSPVPEPFE